MSDKQYERYDSAEMNEYFNSLPELVRESIIQSGAQVSDITQLRELAEKVMH
ncbi:MAG: hypothetical protein IJC18_01845 [Clostridia bacterium]|nr:hypothetical protein [Clostridia bacterium]